LGFAAGSFEVGSDLGGCPFAALDTEQVADGGELVFDVLGKGLLFGGKNNDRLKPRLVAL
jgi:hypothetical protein